MGTVKGAVTTPTAKDKKYIKGRYPIMKQYKVKTTSGGTLYFPSEESAREYVRKNGGWLDGSSGMDWSHTTDINQNRITRNGVVYW